MLNETDKIIGYSVDYRTSEKGTSKAASVMSTGFISDRPKVNRKATCEKCDTHGELSSIEYNFDTINIVKPATRKVGLYRLFFACVMMILSVAGIMILMYALSRTTIVMSNSSSNSKYSNYIAPVVMHDPAPFEDGNFEDINTKIASCIWRNIFQNGISAYNEFDEQGLTLMPTCDIQKACTELFGPNATINMNENINGPFFSCTAGEECFHIGTTSNANSFVPYIDSVDEKKDMISLAVSYLSRDDKYFSANNDSTDKPSPVKRMIYNLKLSEGTNKYYIHSIENP